MPQQYRWIVEGEIVRVRNMVQKARKDYERCDSILAAMYIIAFAGFTSEILLSSLPKVHNTL